MDKKYVIGLLSTVIILPALVFGRDHIGKVWAAPASIDNVDKRVDAIAETQKQLVELNIKTDQRMSRIESRQDVSDTTQKLQNENLAAQVTLLKELVKEVKK